MTNLTEKIDQGGERKLSIKEKLADTFGNVTYSLVVGGTLDYASGLNPAGIITSRAYATAVNSATGALYGMWRNFMFELTKTNDKSKGVRKYLTDLLAFNTFQVPIYATALSVASLVSEGHVNLEKVEKGVTYLAAISPFVGPTTGWYMDKCRKFIGVKSAPEKAGEVQ